MGGIIFFFTQPSIMGLKTIAEQAYGVTYGSSAPAARKWQQRTWLAATFLSTSFATFCAHFMEPTTVFVPAHVLAAFCLSLIAVAIFTPHLCARGGG